MSDARPPLDSWSGLSCPTPVGTTDRVLLGHGSGGRLAAELLATVFLPAFPPTTGALEDAAIVASGAERIAITTDAFVVSPLFFPGGDIGKLAVNGTLNDLAVAGAEPLALTAAFILEEGLDLETLHRVVASMRDACALAGVTLVTGDTKVVDRGKADRLFITTTGIGRVPAGRSLSITNAKVGDVIILSGSIGDHGMAVLSVREGIDLESPIRSDSAALHGLTAVMLAAAPNLRAMRDPTRGGLASTLNELAVASKVGVRIDERAIPVGDAVRGACELLGIDPLYVANEGKLAAIVPANEADALLAAMRAHPLGRDAVVIGQIAGEPGLVVLRSSIGGERIVPMLAGDQLPRIC